MTFKIEDLKFESEEGKKGFYNFVQFLKKCKRGDDLNIDTALLAAYMIQKQHESHQWWVETVGNQISSLLQEIRLLQAELYGRN